MGRGCHGDRCCLASSLMYSEASCHLQVRVRVQVQVRLSLWYCVVCCRQGVWLGGQQLSQVEEEEEGRLMTMTVTKV